MGEGVRDLPNVPNKLFVDGPLETNPGAYIVPTKIIFLKLREQCFAEMISI